MATKRTITKKVETPENRKEEVKQNITKKDVVLCRNVICQYGTYEAGKTYSVSEVIADKLKKLGALR